MSWTGRAAVTGTAIACALLMTGGCSKDQTAPPAPTSSTTAAPSPSPTISSEETVVLETYRAFWKARVQTLAHPEKSLPKALTRYSTGQAVTDIRATVLLFRQQGIEMRGEPKLLPKVSEIAATKATVTDCVDGANWKPVYAATGKSADAGGGATRVTMTSNLTKEGDAWLVATATIERDRTC